MLLEFSIENYRSIAQKQVFSMVASGQKYKLDENSFLVPNQPQLHLLKSSLIYGANASGKSNILRSLSVIKDIVTQSATRIQTNDKLPVFPFLLDREYAAKPSNFAIVFIQDNIRYQYSISLDQNRIYEETLTAYPKGRSQLWFKRLYHQETHEYNWYFGPQLKGAKQIIKMFVRPNSLFLSHGAQNNHPQLTSVYEWFSKKLFIFDFDGVDFIENYDDLTAIKCHHDAAFSQLIMKFLTVADIDILDLDISSKSLKDKYKNQENLLNLLKNNQEKTEISDNNYESKSYTVQTIRKMNNSEDLVKFSLEQESQGTQRLFKIMGPFLIALIEGKIIVIDELGKSLHPIISKLIMSVFNSNNNYRGSQILFTTHDTSLLDQDILRSEQIWFTEKNEHKETQLYCLADFKPVKNESLQTGYLQGRYGAIPFISKFKF